MMYGLKMTFSEYKSIKENMFYKKISLALFILLIIALSIPVKAAECMYNSSSGTNSGGEYWVYKELSDPVSACSGAVVMDGFEYSELKTKADMTETIAIDPLDIAESFTWGFGTYLTFWWLSFVIKSARMTIKRM